MKIYSFGDKYVLEVNQKQFDSLTDHYERNEATVDYEDKEKVFRGTPSVISYLSKTLDVEVVELGDPVSFLVRVVENKEKLKMSQYEELLAACEHVAKLEAELQRAYRCIQGLYNAVKSPEESSEAMLAYQSPTIAAAKRFVFEGVLDGSEYFINKPVEVLQTAMKLGTSK